MPRKLTMKDLLQQQVDVLKQVKEKVGIDDVADIIEAQELDDLDCTNVNHVAYPLVYFACGYIRGVAEERDMTIRELFDEEGILT